MDPSSSEEPVPFHRAPQVPAAVDEADMLALPLGTEPPTEVDSSLKPGIDTAEQIGLTAESTKPSLPNDGLPVAARPMLKREKSVPMPAPQHLPPPAPPAPPLDAGNPTDSLSLMQLRRLVTEMPKVEPTPYAFVYQDASSFTEELEEWFSYSVEEQAMILKTQTSFAREWGTFNGLVFINGSAYEEGGLDWAQAEAAQRKQFICKLLEDIQQSNYAVRVNSLEALAYIMLGCWHETAGFTSSRNETQGKTALEGAGPGKFTVQVDWIKTNTQAVLESGGMRAIYDVMRASCLRVCGADILDDMSRDAKEAERREVWCSMTAMYVFLELARINEKEEQDLRMRAEIRKLEPNLLLTMMDLISRMRWDETIQLPITKVLLCSWKAILVCLGGLSEVEKAKDSFRDETLETADKRGQPLITASPLDYHLFRQEISSKYPAYNPPPPLFPLEPENNSILPPLKNHPSKAAGSHVFGSGLANLNGNGTSILHQPVHIATPAPSPPPSPAGPGGKGGKKQNYQTNQLFPFLYPPLDESSNNLGGKGSTDLQDALVGRKWKGSDIPASILEAAELFAKRMRASRAMKQLWEERVAFMKYERGWTGPDEDEDIEHLDLSSSEKSVEKEKPAEKPQPSEGSVEERLEAVESFYKHALPQFQSLIIVLVKVILSHVTTLVTQANGQNGLQTGFQYPEGVSTNVQNANGANGEQGDGAGSVEELDAVRSQEILDKAVSGTLILIIKWFKVSHILKFEYITQLLVDSSYIPLILKLLQLQEIERVVNYRCDRDDLNFFNFCHSHSRQANTSVDQDSEDDAVPPPIKRHRDPSAGATSPEPSNAVIQPPEVDELGIPVGALPSEPITTFSWRAFFTSINYLRVMQKICKNKAHRNLMLVSYKSSQFLRKALKVPQPELRLYTLKLFKNQVPYCGRKWRQSNMRVITAVYLHCRPELRDDWLAGSDVDAEVDESVPLEQALRALTHWFNLKRYPQSMGARSGALSEEQDFFRRELEKMDWGDEGFFGIGASDEAGGMESAGPGWDGQIEAW